MRPVERYILSLVVLLSFASIANAVAAEERTINFSVSEVPGLITVSSDLNTTNLLPGFEYHYTLSVRWGIPNESLRAITADRIKLYINVRPVENNTFIYFKKDGEKIRQYFFVLECAIENDSCSNTSVLSKDIEVYYLLAPGANVSLEQLAISASLAPFADEETVEEVDSLISRLSGEHLNEELSKRFDNARRMADDGDYASARDELNKIVSLIPVPTPVSSTPASEDRNNNWDLILGILLALVVLLLVVLSATFLSRKGRRRNNKEGFEALEEHEIKGHDYVEEPETPPENVEYKPPEEKKGDQPVVQRVPDWFG